MTSPAMITEVVLPGVVEPDGLQLHRRAMPVPARGQALVQVEATGISFAEQQMRHDRYPGQPKFPFVPGYDLVGTVRAVGPGADDSIVGTRVAAVTKTGGWATHALVDIDALTPVPAELDPAAAETVVVNGVTAWQMLRSTRLRAGQTILVHGANGGVGTVSSAPQPHGTTTRCVNSASNRSTTVTRTWPRAYVSCRRAVSTPSSTRWAARVCAPRTACSLPAAPSWSTATPPPSTPASRSRGSS
jgi:hypothetical protein